MADNVFLRPESESLPAHIAQNHEIFGQKFRGSELYEPVEIRFLGVKIRYPPSKG